MATPKLCARRTSSYLLLAFASLMLLVIGAPKANAGAIHDAGLFTTVLPANDDGSTGLVSMGMSINFNGVTYGSLYVNNNGNVTFTGPLYNYTPWGITGGTTPMLAPYFADVDTRAGNVVTYGTNTINGKNVFGVDWINVGYYAFHTDLLNSFQLIVTDRSDIAAGDFDFEFNYDKIQWETGDASGGSGGMGGSPAHAGWTNGAGSFYEFPGSGTSGYFEDSASTGLIYGSLNSNILGQYLFEVRNGQVQPPPSGIPEPASLLLLGTGLGALGLAAWRRRK